MQVTFDHNISQSSCSVQSGEKNTHKYNTRKPSANQHKLSNNHIVLKKKGKQFLRLPNTEDMSYINQWQVLISCTWAPDRWVHNCYQSECSHIFKIGVAVSSKYFACTAVFHLGKTTVQDVWLFDKYPPLKLPHVWICVQLVKSDSIPLATDMHVCIHRDIPVGLVRLWVAK